MTTTIIEILFCIDNDSRTQAHKMSYLIPRLEALIASGFDRTAKTQARLFASVYLRDALRRYIKSYCSPTTTMADLLSADDLAVLRQEIVDEEHDNIIGGVYAARYSD